MGTHGSLPRRSVGCAGRNGADFPLSAGEPSISRKVTRTSHHAIADLISVSRVVVREERVESNRLLGVLALFVVAYVVVLYLTATLFDAGISVEGRLLVPIQVAGAVLVVGLVYRAVARVAGARVGHRPRAKIDDRRAAGGRGGGVDLPVDPLLGERARCRVRAAALGPHVGGAQRRVPLAVGGPRAHPRGAATTRIAG